MVELAPRCSVLSSIENDSGKTSRGTCTLWYVLRVKMTYVRTESAFFLDPGLPVSPFFLFFLVLFLFVRQLY